MARRLSLLAAVAALTLAACGSGDDTVSLDDTDVATSLTEDDASDVGPDSDGGDVSVPDAPVEDCPPLDGAEEQTRSFESAPSFCLEPGVAYSATVTTSVGEFTIDFDQDAAPQAVNSFVFLARNNYFDDTVCHRIIQSFVVQCGDPTATGTGGPGYVFDDELPEAGSYRIGSIAMANSGPNTNGSQFFVITGPDGAALPPLYSLFGQVRTDDLDVVETMNALGSLDASGTPQQQLSIESVAVSQA